MRAVVQRGGLVLAGLFALAMASAAYSAFRDFVGDEAVVTAPGAGSDSALVAELPPLALPDSLLGRSRSLRFATLTAADANELPGFLDRYGEEALWRPAALRVRSGADSFALLVLRPFAEKRGEVLNGYRLGYWPAERWLTGRNYLNPDGFVEVMPEHVTLPLSTHFQLGDFLMHDQDATWPKYVVLEEKLLDKLELVVQELAAKGFRADHVVVLSGFRAPYHNERRIDEGAARTSRHQYGDAADILLDSDADGRMDDLNRDGRVDLRDVEPISAAVARVEGRHPELTGGLGTYAAMGPSGPFAHVDVRGTSARWERAQRSP
jgi:hypothetical protein